MELFEPNYNVIDGELYKNFWDISLHKIVFAEYW